MAAIGWAGLLAECLAYGGDCNFENWQVEAYEVFEEFLDTQFASETDRQSILSHPHYWRTCKIAAGILAKKREAVSLLAQYLIKSVEITYKPMNLPDDIQVVVE